MQFEHIHLGAGRQGVGGVVPLSCAAGGRVHVVVHRGSELSPDCVLVCNIGAADGEVEDCALMPASISRANTIEQLDPQARAALLTAPELLLTTALSPLGVLAQSDFLLALTQVRAERGRRTIFIPCEEETGEEHTQLLEQLRSLGADVRRCALYRLSSQDLRRSGRRDRRAVVVAEEAEWVIDGEADSDLLRTLQQAPEISFSVYIDQHRLRIRWLASGGRLSLALLAAEAKQPQLASAEAECGDWLERIHDALVPLVQERCPDLNCIEGYAERRRTALLQHKDDGMTALRNMRRTTLRPFMHELQRLIGDPWRAYMRTGALIPAELSRLLSAMHTVLSDIESYGDFEPYAWGDMLLEASADQRAIEAYVALLTGVLPPKRVTERAKELSDRLNEHREDLPG